MNHNKLFIAIIIILFVVISHSKGYQLFQVNQSQLINNDNAYSNSACRVSEEKILFLERDIILNYSLIYGPLFNISDRSATYVQKIANLIQFYWSKIKGIDYLIFIMERKICVEKLQAMQNKKESYMVCTYHNTSFIITAQISRELMLISQEYNSTRIYTVESKNSRSYLNQYKIYEDGSIEKSIISFVISIQTDIYAYQKMLKFKNLLCIFYTDPNYHNSLFNCFDFEKQITYDLINLTLIDQEIEYDRILVLEEEILIWYSSQISQKIPLYSIDIQYDEVNITTTQKNITLATPFGEDNTLITANGDFFVVITYVDTGKLIKFFKIINDKIYDYQIIPEKPQVQLFQLICKNENAFVFLRQRSQKYGVEILNKIEGKQNFMTSICTIPFLITLGISFALIFYYLIRYRIQVAFYFNQIKIYALSQLITQCLLYGVVGLICLTLDLNHNQTFNYYIQKEVVLDSSFSKLFYYLTSTSALINCIFIIFTERNNRTQFIHLLSKHSFNLYVFLGIKIVFFIVLKATIYSIINIVFIYYMQSMFIDEIGRIFCNIFEGNDDEMIILVITTIFFNISLSFITLIIVQITSYWYSLEIILVLFFGLSFITEYFHKENDLSKLQIIFIYLSPFTILDTIIQTALMIKIKYSKFIQQNSINFLFLRFHFQFIILALIFFILAFRKIKNYSIQQLIKISKESSNSPLVINEGLNSNNQQEPFQTAHSEDLLLLQAFIPCKISTYKGFQKKILNNIDFKGYRHQLISFIDYGNQSKSALMKILTNDEKSDSFLEEDLKGQIYYSRNVKIGFCSDKNILSDHFNAIQHLSLFLSLKKRDVSKKDIKAQVDFMLDEFNITDQDRVKPVKLLSGGNKRKVCLACAFIGNPDIVLLNDPTNGLDLRFKRIFLQKLKLWKQNKLIIVCTSNNDEAQMISDKIWIINNGKISDYLSSNSAIYFQLILDFFQNQNFQFCKNITDKQFKQSQVFKYYSKVQDAYRLKLQVYDIKNYETLTKISKLLKVLTQKYDKTFNFYFKTLQTKFTVEQFYKYRKFMQQNLSYNEAMQKMQGIISKQVIKVYELQQNFQINDSQSYYEKQIKKILLELSNIQKCSNVCYQKIRSTIYFKICFIKNQKLFLRETLFVNLFLWAANIIDLVYNNNNGQRQHFYNRILSFYCYFMISVIFNSPLDQQNRNLLTSIGTNFLYLWIGQFLSNTLYIYLSFLINTSIYFLLSLLFVDTIQQDILGMYIGSLLYIMNFTLFFIVLQVITKNKQINFIIISLLTIYPTYILNDVFLINYPTIALTAKQILSYFMYQVSLARLFQNIMLKPNSKSYYLAVMLYELAILIAILLIYQRNIRNKKHDSINNYHQIHNVANDSIIQEQRVVQDLFEDKQIIYGHNICKKYPKQKRDQPSLRNIYFHCRKGQILAFVGHNGCGKTTLFNIITQKTVQTRGQISILGKLHEQMCVQDFLNTAYCSQEGQLFYDFTVEQNIRFIGLLKGLAQRYLTKFAIKMLRYFMLDNKQKALISQLTQGQRKKISIIISLLGFPCLMVYDEPTSSIDSQSRDKIFYMIKSYCKMFKSIILITTHNISQAENNSDRVAILKKGVLLKIETPQDLIKHPSQQLYKLVISFNFNENNVVINRKKQIVINKIRQYKYINIITQEGFKLIYGLDLVKINMYQVFCKMLKWFQEDTITRFDLYKYNLEEVVKYNMAVDQSHQVINEMKKTKKKLLIQI